MKAAHHHDPDHRRSMTVTTDGTAPVVTVGPEGLSLCWPAVSGPDTIALPHLWLRDNCPCDECRVTQTGEKKFHLTSVPVDVTPAEATITDDALALVWPDGHRTTMSADLIRSAIAGRPVPQIRHWSQDFNPMRVDHHQFFADADVAISAFREFLSTGVLVLTDAPTEPNSLEDFTSRLGPMREMHFARVHNVEVDPSGYNVAHTNLPLPPHNDFAGMSWPPSVQALHMLANEVDDGLSVVVDGYGVLADLRSESPELFDALLTTALPFRMWDESTETYTVQPMVEVDVNGEISRLRYSNQVMQPMDPTGPTVTDFYRAYHRLSEMIVDRQNQARFRLEGGHVLLVASHRVLHARDGFVPNGRRHLQDAYFEHDNMRNHLFVLERDQKADHS